MYKTYLVNIIIVVLAATCLFGCCASKRTPISVPVDIAKVIDSSNMATDNILVDSLRQILVSNLLHYTSFSAKIKIASTQNDKANTDVTATLRMIKDSAVWVSLTATFLNVEVYRILITNDSVILLNKLQKEVLYRDIDFLQEITGLPFSLHSIQEFIIGNPVFVNPGTADYFLQADTLLVKDESMQFKTLLTLLGSGLRLASAYHEAGEGISALRANLGYDGYEKIEEKSFSTQRDVSIFGPDVLRANLLFSQLEFNKELNLNFPVAKNYEEK